MKFMKVPGWRIAGLIFVIGLVAGLWLWRQGVLPAQQPPTPAPRLSSTAATPTTDSFLPVSRVAGVSIVSIITKNFVIPAGTNMNKVTTVVTTGDVIPARGVDIQIRQHGADFPFADKGIVDLLSKADVAIVNLESPLTADCPVHREGFTFCGQPAFAPAMAKAGIDIATLANNHIGNYGQAGIQETVGHLTDAGVRSAEAGKAHIETVGDLTIGILAYNGIERHFDRVTMEQAVKQLRPKVDLLFVAVHWGKEYELMPTTDGSIAPDDPQEIGHLLVDAGADVVIGNHPHWVQGVQVYKGKLINYAQGNFIFDQSWSRETQQGLLTKYTFYENKLIGAEFYPYHIYDQAQPRLVEGAEADEIWQRFKQSTMQLSTPQSN
jgi:poly-gamma-glutamate synthesis protein (capsule biosynthesis protein)